MLLLFLLSISFFCKAQQSSAAAIPPFRILQPNGTFFTADDLTKNKPTVIIYFAPDCGHCHTLMEAYFKRAQEFTKAQVVMVTFKPVQELNGFINHYSTHKYPNIIIGTEGTTFFLRYYYKLTDTPFVALYDRNGHLVYAYRKISNVDDLIHRLQGMK